VSQPADTPFTAVVGFGTDLGTWGQAELFNDLGSVLLNTTVYNSTYFAVRLQRMASPLTLLRADSPPCRMHGHCAPIRLRCVCALCALCAQVMVPRMQGTAQLRLRIQGSRSYSNMLSFTYPAPDVAAVGPAVLSSRGGTRVTLSGTHLGVDVLELWATLGSWNRRADLASVVVNTVVLVSVVDSSETNCPVLSVRRMSPC
jgi:hypothetical protein